MSQRRTSSAAVAVTGGIGSGKSTVSQSLAAMLKLPRIDIDLVCRQLLEKEQAGWQALRKHLAGHYFAADEQVDRRRLRSAIFADDGLRRQIDGLIHPLVRKELASRLDACQAEMVLVDVPLLYEVQWQQDFFRCIVVYADRPTRCRRLILRDGLSAEEAGRSMDCQLPLWRKALLADHVIDNSSCWSLTRMQVAHLALLLQDPVAEQ
jgi:dephospho-CoA kinase